MEINKEAEKFTLNYIKCPNCKNILNLSFAKQACPNPLCAFDFNGLEEYINKSDGELHKALISAHKGEDERKLKLLAVAVKFNIASYLAHFVACNWGAHYQTLFKDFIISYLDDLNALKIVLKSDIIRTDKNNAIESKNGHRMFFELYKWLMKVHNTEIRSFLRLEFPEFYRKFYKKQHEKHIRQKISVKNNKQTKLI